MNVNGIVLDREDFNYFKNTGSDKVTKITKQLGIYFLSNEVMVVECTIYVIFLPGFYIINNTLEASKSRSPILRNIHLSYV